MNISWTFLDHFSSLLGGCNSKATPNPPKSDNKYVEEMFMKCSTAQSFIRMEMTTYRIGTLGPTRLFIFGKSCHLHCFLLSKYQKIPTYTPLLGPTCLLISEKTSHLLTLLLWSHASEYKSSKNQTTNSKFPISWYLLM